MSGRLLEVAVRPVRIAFLLGRNPSNRLLNSVISVNSGMWGGIHNLLCPTNGSSIADDYLQLLKSSNPDCIILCGRFNNRQKILRQLEGQSINPCFLYRNSAVSDIEKFGLGIEGIFDRKFLQNWQRGALISTAIVNPRLGRTTIHDKVLFGIPPDRLKEYIEDRIDIITVNRYKKESERQTSDYDELIGIVQVTAENLDRYRIIKGRRLIGLRYPFGWPYFVVGKEDSLDDACYFWNLRAVFGSNIVEWVERRDLMSFFDRLRGVIRPTMRTRVSMTSISEDLRQSIDQAMKGMNLADRTVRFIDPRAFFRQAPNFTWKSELRREHTTTSGDEFVIPVRRPSSFELVYPPRLKRWVMDLRIVQDKAIGTEGFVLPGFSYLSETVTPVRTARLKPRILGEVFSLQVTSAPVDEYVRLRIPSNWDVIQAIFSQAGHKINLSDQGNYMSRTLSLFGGLARLSALLLDARVTAILDEFLKHHRTGERVTDGTQYRRALTLETMRAVVINLLRHKSRKKKEETFQFVDQLLKELMVLRAIHSGYVLDCSYCSLEEWYPIDEVAETFRCRRCLATQTRPPGPPIHFRLNEALYQAYLNNFAVPTLVLDILSTSSNSSFIFTPQIKLNAADVHSPELDLVAICDGTLTIGEAKSTNKIKKGQLATLESIALGVKARHIVVGTTSRESCRDIDCNICSKHRHYADDAFSHGSTAAPKFWGTREHVKDLRNRLVKQGIRVTSICAEDLLKGSMERDLPRPIPVTMRRKT